MKIEFLIHGTSLVAPIPPELVQAIGAAAGTTADISLENGQIMIKVDEGEPNAETAAAIEAADRGELARFNSIDDLFADLHADD